MTSNAHLTATRRSPGQLAMALCGRPYLSYSAAATFAACPLKYYFKYVAGLPEQFISASLVFGRAIHTAVEHWYQQRLEGNGPPDHQELMALYHASWGELRGAPIQFGKSDSAESLASLAERMLLAFRDSPLAALPGVILAVEEELRGDVLPGCPDLLARVDLITETPEALVITDFKTARSRWDQQKINESAGQLLLYHELAKRLSDKPVRLQFAVLTKTKSPTAELHGVPVDARRIAREKQAVRQIWHAIQAGHVYPAPSPMQCSSCPFQQPCSRWPG